MSMTSVQMSNKEPEDMITYVNPTYIHTVGFPLELLGMTFISSTVLQGGEKTKDRSVPDMRGRHPKTHTRWHE